MTDVTVSYRVAFRKRDGSALAPRPRAATRQGEAGPAVPALPAEPSPAARMLALAHWIERQVRSRALKDYREAAARLGVSHARVSQIRALLMLPCAVQADVLLGRTLSAELALRRVAGRAAWREVPS